MNAIRAPATGETIGTSAARQSVGIAVADEFVCKTRANQVLDVDDISPLASPSDA